MVTPPRTHGRIKKYLDDRQRIVSRHRTLQAARERALQEERARRKVQIARDTSPSAFKYAVQTRR